MTVALFCAENEVFAGPGPKAEPPRVAPARAIATAAEMDSAITDAVANIPNDRQEPVSAEIRRFLINRKNNPRANVSVELINKIVPYIAAIPADQLNGIVTDALRFTGPDDNMKGDLVYSIVRSIRDIKNNANILDFTEQRIYRQARELAGERTGNALMGIDRLIGILVEVEGGVDRREILVRATTALSHDNINVNGLCDIFLALKAHTGSTVLELAEAIKRQHKKGSFNEMNADDITGTIRDFKR